jgi:hypothetical protein
MREKNEYFRKKNFIAFVYKMNFVQQLNRLFCRAEKNVLTKTSWNFVWFCEIPAEISSVI